MLQMARECLQEGISRGAQPVSLLQDMLCTLLAEAVDELSRGEDQATDAPPCACAAESPSGSSLGGPGVPCAEAGRSLAGTVRPRTLFASAASEGCPATAEAVGSCRQWSSGVGASQSRPLLCGAKTVELWCLCFSLEYSARFSVPHPSLCLCCLQPRNPLL